MKYSGKDAHVNECKKFFDNNCVIEKLEDEDGFFKLNIYTKNEKEQVISIKGFLYNYKAQYNNGKKLDSFHIKSLSAGDRYEQCGYGTYAMKEAIKYAELKKIKRITVHPSACTNTISQTDLETFYRKFNFSTGFHKNKEIEFAIILD